MSDICRACNFCHAEDALYALGESYVAVMSYSRRSCVPEAHSPCEAELAVHGTSHLRGHAQSGARLEAALPHHRYQYCLYCTCNILILQMQHGFCGFPVNGALEQLVYFLQMLYSNDPNVHTSIWLASIAF